MKGPMKYERFGEGYSTEARYNTKAVVNETGVPADTFRAWERRYGTPMPHRTATGQRLYSERDIAIVRWLRDRTAAGLTVSQAVRLLTSEHEMPEHELDPADWHSLRQGLVEALARLDPVRADTILAQAFARFPLDDVCLQLIEPTLVEIGERWHAGMLSVGQEHFASGFIRRKLHALLNVYDVVAGHMTIVAACMPGEQHDIGLLILSLALVRRGYRVVYLGADLPLEGLLPIVEQTHPVLVCLSASTTTSAEQIVPIATALRALPRAPIVVAGGRGLAEREPQGDLFIRLKGNAVEAAIFIGKLITQADAEPTD
jgi:methanogenic corrinoid protein MtbC1